MPPVKAEQWLELFALQPTISGDASSWARAFAARPRAGWEACPRGEWLVAAAVRARVDPREVVSALATTISAISNELDRMGRPEPPALRRTIELAEAWADGVAELEELRGAERALDGEANELARRLLRTTIEAATDGASLAERAAQAMHALGDPLGPRGHEATAAVLRSLLAWERVEAAITAPK